MRHAIADYLRTKFAIDVFDVFDVANWRHWPALGTILHSDHRSHCIAFVFGRRRAARVGGQRRKRFHNAIAEFFFASTQAEFADRRRTRGSRSQLASRVFE